MKHIHVGEKLSKKCKKDIRDSLKYLESSACRHYQNYRDHGAPGGSELPSSGTVKPLTQEDIQSLDKHRSEILRQVREHRNRNE